MEQNLYNIIIFLFGIVIGSFLNVVIYRLPRNKEMVKSRSVCTKCNQQLKWYHNIPLFSYIFLGGRCSFCKGRISIRYPLVELANGLLYLYFFFQYKMTIEFVVYA
ncbi:MAG: prepilin peptidase, partial [Candidatus Zixiibacteriota bacterium]